MSSAPAGRSQTHIVQSAYKGRDGHTRVYVKGHPLPLLCDEPLEEGAAVFVREGKAVRP